MKANELISPSRRSVNAAPVPNRPHVLYRFYDVTGSLLYVGITVSLWNRLPNHQATKAWYGDIVTIKVEHFPDRDTARAAETEAIRAERPRHNVHHNGDTDRKPRPVRNPHRYRLPEWTFASRESGYERTEPLWLVWELDGDPLSDDYCTDEIDAEDLWRRWLTDYPRDEAAEAVYGPGAVAIHWFVSGSSSFEAAPYQDPRPRAAAARLRGWGADWRPQHFLDFHTTPLSANTGEPIKWMQLHVTDKVWREFDLPAHLPYTHKGGFIQEATGWKPSPLQPYVNVRQLARVSGLFYPEAAS